MTPREQAEAIRLLREWMAGVGVAIDELATDKGKVIGPAWERLKIETESFIRLAG